MKGVVKIAAGTVCAAALIAVLYQRTMLLKVRQENQKLRNDHEEVKRLAHESAEMDRLRAENQEIEKLRLETRDIHVLRNEVHQLRQREPEFEQVRAENERLQSALKTTAQSSGQSSSATTGPAPLITKEALSDAGFGSPEATLQTFVWAMRADNVEKMRACFVAEPPPDRLPPAPDTEGVRIVAKTVVSAEMVKLGFQIFDARRTEPEELVLPFKRIGNDWKIDMFGP